MLDGGPAACASSASTTWTRHWWHFMLQAVRKCRPPRRRQRDHECMTDTSDSFAQRGSRTNPEAIAERSFSQVKRGYAEAEVRAYLRMVSSEFAASLARERDLAARIRELEGQLRKPSLPPTDQELINALGEETARVLGQARESAAELRAKAEEHARRVVREAQETARELRTTTQQAVETKTREAEDAARNRAKEIVGEARALPERVLADLT